MQGRRQGGTPLSALDHHCSRRLLDPAFTHAQLGLWRRGERPQTPAQNERLRSGPCLQRGGGGRCASGCWGRNAPRSHATAAPCRTASPCLAPAARPLVLAALPDLAHPDAVRCCLQASGHAPCSLPAAPSARRLCGGWRRRAAGSQVRAGCELDGSRAGDSRRRTPVCCARPEGTAWLHLLLGWRLRACLHPASLAACVPAPR